MTSAFVYDTCMLLRHDATAYRLDRGCGKGKVGKGGKCVPARAGQGGGLKQGGKKWGAGKTAAAIVGGTLAAGAVGAGVTAATPWGQRQIGKAEEGIGRGINKATEQGKDIYKKAALKVGKDISENPDFSDKQKKEAYEGIGRQAKGVSRVAEAAKNLGDHFRRSGKARQAKNRKPHGETMSRSRRLPGGEAPKNEKPKSGNSTKPKSSKPKEEDFIEGEFRTVK